MVVSASPQLNLSQNLGGGKCGENHSKASPLRFFKTSKLHMHTSTWRLERCCSTENWNNPSQRFLFPPVPVPALPPRCIWMVQRAEQKNSQKLMAGGSCLSEPVQIQGYQRRRNRSTAPLSWAAFLSFFRGSFQSYNSFKSAEAWNGLLTFAWTFGGYTACAALIKCRADSLDQWSEIH